MRVQPLERLRPAARRLRRSARWLGNRLARSALILGYHRVAALPSDPHALCVTPQHFAEHLEILRQYGRPIRLQELVLGLRQGTLAQRALVVTFDDGYADNLYNAKPLLERYEIPATVFVTAGYLAHAREFWWDELERLLLQPGRLPETLHLSINGSSFRWESEGTVRYQEDAAKPHPNWKLRDKDDPGPRHRLYRLLYHLVRPLPGEERSRVLDDLVTWASAQSVCRATHRPLSADEVCGLIKERLIEVGAHTVTHPVLAALPAAAQRAEIQRSKALLEDTLARPVTSFSYPYGLRSHYTEETVGIVQETGFACACSAFAGVVRRGTRLFELPRVFVPDWDGDAFARRLTEWFPPTL